MVLLKDATSNLDQKEKCSFNKFQEKMALGVQRLKTHNKSDRTVALVKAWTTRDQIPNPLYAMNSAALPDIIAEMIDILAKTLKFTSIVSFELWTIARALIMSTNE